MTMPEWRALVRLSEAELATVDVAVLNLACAVGLPGTGQVDPARCLAVLDSWADHVRRETERAAHQFRHRPQDFQDSWAYFRVLVLATVLQEDCGVSYNPALIE